MTFLKWLSALRTPFLDAVFYAITQLGDETLFLAVGLALYWCIHKKAGRYVLTIGLMGSLISQWLKMICRIPRPWVRDPSHTIVEKARAGAGGYSFPSGHSQSSVGTFGGIAMVFRKKRVMLPALALAVLVPFSRLYLGVHTPADVLVGSLISVALIFVLYPLMMSESPAKERFAILLSCVIATAYVLFFPMHGADTPEAEANILHGLENAWKLLGSAFGLWLAFELDEAFIRFDPRAGLPMQIFKLAVGLALCLGLRVALKAAFAVLPSAQLADALRYFLIAVFGGAGWPAVFSTLQKRSIAAHS